MTRESVLLWLDRRNGRRVLLVAFLALNAALLNAVVSLFAFALRHSELTQTQVLLRIGEALLWR